MTYIAPGKFAREKENPLSASRQPAQSANQLVIDDLRGGRITSAPFLVNSVCNVPA
jgi:hypothetical protein